ncbi:MAG: putative baseplate assembly protein [Enhygromyxa sp.]
MPLPSPILDDRSYAQLRDELIRRIPVYNREWSDHNPSDPGITLIELFAYLGETLLFRFNQIPEATKLEFLRLLQIAQRPPQPARGLLRLAPQIDPSKLEIPLIAQGTVARAGAIEFELQTEVRALPLSAVALCKAARELPDPDEEPERFAELQAVIDALDGLDSDEEIASYEPLELDPEAQGPAVDFNEAVDGCLWIALIAPDDLDPIEVRDALVGHQEAPLLLNLGFVPDLAAPPPEQVDPCPGEGGSGSGSAIEWQISTGQISGDQPSYLALKLAGDSTGGLEREGVVRLQLPRRADELGNFAVAPELIGARDFPPAIDEQLAPQVVAWIRAFRRDGAGFGKVQWIGANVSELIQQRQAKTAFLGTGDGQPDQVVSLLHAPVIPGSLVLEVEEPEGWVRWTEVDGFHASREDDRHFVLDHASGQVRFGNGLGGRAPQWGQRIRAKRWLWGGGVEGNVAARAITKIDAAKVEGDNPLPAWGGAAGETIAEALERIPGELRRRDRCMARRDFSELALQTPGTDLIRAETLPRFHPPTRVSEAAGIVSVVVWPRRDPLHPSAPVPDSRTLRRVCEWLDARRLVTTELYVIPPRYVKIAVAVGIVVKPGYPIEGVRRWAELILRQYLAPVPPHGPEGQGWPLGRRVVAGELEAAVSQVEGVEYVRNLRLAGWDAPSESWVEVVADREADPPIEATIELRLDELPELAEVTVIDGPAMAPGQQIGPPPPAKTPVPVPLEREEC